MHFGTTTSARHTLALVFASHWSHPVADGAADSSRGERAYSTPLGWAAPRTGGVQFLAPQVAPGASDEPDQPRPAGRASSEA